MKKLLIITISLLIIISGCSLNHETIQKISLTNDSIIIDMAMSDKQLAILEYDDSQDQGHNIIQLYQLDNLNKVSYEMNDGKLEYASSCEYDSEGMLTLYDEVVERKGTYNEKMELIKSEAYDSTTKIEEIDNNMIGCNLFYDKHFAYENSEYNIINNKEEASTYIALENNQEQLLLYPHEQGSIWDYDGSNILASYWNQEEDKINLEVFDVKTKNLINRYCIENVYAKQGYLVDACINQDKVSFIWCNNDEIVLYLWDYRSNMINEKSDLVAINNKEIDKINQQLEADIEKSYDIEIYVDKIKSMMGEYDLEYDIDYGGKKLDVFYFLKKYESFLATLPKGLINDLSNNEEFGKRTFEVHLVKEIIGDTQAFAYAYFDNKIIMCFASQELMESDFPHELMHVMNSIIPIRLYDNENNRSYYDEWIALNPKNFDYYNQNQFSDYEQYFISEYMMSNPEEDQAVMFESIYDVLKTDTIPYWAQSKPLLNKASYLLETIKTCFPSVKQSNWEKMFEQVKEWNEDV